MKTTTTEKKTVMSTSSGCPMMNPRYSLTAGHLGGTLFEDVELFDKLQHFTREQLPPRNVHALGVGAFGTFKATNDVSKYTSANLFSKGTETQLFSRFSGVFTGREEAETLRDMRGFALKFYTKEGNWDLLTVNIPVFGANDAKSGPDTIHAMKRDPRTGEWNTDTVWDFTVNHPEALHQTILLLHDQFGTPRSYRNQNWSACNTFSFINKDGIRSWVRFELKTSLSSKGLTSKQAKLIGGENPDLLRQDLRKSIENGSFPEWKLFFQTMSEGEGLKLGEHVFDATRSWCPKTYPLIELGVIQLNRNPTDHLFQTEQVAFSPSNVVPGIGFSPDRLLQGRLFLYPDTQYHRLGPNFRQIPVNMPTNHADTPYIGGPHRHEASHFPAYYPSLMDGLEPQAEPAKLKQPKVQEAAGCFSVSSDGPSRIDQISDTIKNYPDNNLSFNIARSLSRVTEKEIVIKSLELIKKVDGSLVDEVQNWLSKFEKGDESALSEGQLLLRQLQAVIPQV